MAYTSETSIRRLVRIRRERVLPKPGEILVGNGTRVEATQVVGRTSLSGEFRIVPVARLLDVPAAQVERYLQVELGDTVHQGDVVARRGGLLGRSAKSPIDGTVVAHGGGRVLIEAQPTPVELRAYISGTVVHVRDNRRVLIEAAGALVQGIWGAGGEGIGVLKVVVGGPDAPLRARAIDASCHGAVLIVGVTDSGEALERARDMEAHGLVTGGLVPELISLVEQLSFPVVVTEGIGDAPMIRPIFQLLQANDGREASISGQPTSHRDGRRPEVIIPKPDRRGPVEEGGSRGEVTVGTRVRIVRAPFMGAVGTVVGLPDHARRIETGARVRCADVDVGWDEPVSIPLVNLDILRQKPR
jgi:hypothetical protein